MGVLSPWVSLCFRSQYGRYGNRHRTFQIEYPFFRIGEIWHKKINPCSPALVCVDVSQPFNACRCSGHHRCEYMPWWRHQVEAFSTLLAFCAWNSPTAGEFPAQKPLTRSFDIFFDLGLNQRLNKQWRRRWFETPSRSLWRHCYAQTQYGFLKEKRNVFFFYIPYSPNGHRDNEILYGNNQHCEAWWRIYASVNWLCTDLSTVHHQAITCCHDKNNQTCWFKEVHLKTSSAKYRPFCSGLGAFRIHDSINVGWLVGWLVGWIHLCTEDIFGWIDLCTRDIFPGPKVGRAQSSTCDMELYWKPHVKHPVLFRKILHLTHSGLLTHT